MFKNPEAISLAPICNGIKKLANVPERPAVSTQKTNIVPCIVTKAKYLSGFKPPASFSQALGSKLYNIDVSPGLANWTLKIADINIPTTAINIPVKRNCFAIIL